MLSLLITRNQRTILVSNRLLLILLLLFYMFSVCKCTSCFECSSLNETYCPEMMSDDDEAIIAYNSCDYIHEGKFCVKATGIIGVTTGELFCFVCDETDSQDFGCSSALFSAPLTSCRDTFDAHYCIKTVGLYAGSLGTRRFCSSRDLGNYCEYIKRPGDQREYRSCVYTCSGNGCNSTKRSSLPNSWSIVAASVLSLFVYFRGISSSTVFTSTRRLSARGSLITTSVIR